MRPHHEELWRWMPSHLGAWKCQDCAQNKAIPVYVCIRLLYSPNNLQLHWRNLLSHQQWTGYPVQAASTQKYENMHHQSQHFQYYETRFLERMMELLCIKRIMLGKYLKGSKNIMRGMLNIKSLIKWNLNPIMLKQSVTPLIILQKLLYILYDIEHLLNLAI